MRWLVLVAAIGCAPSSSVITVIPTTQPTSRPAPDPGTKAAKRIVGNEHVLLPDWAARWAVAQGYHDFVVILSVKLDKAGAITSVNVLTPKDPPPEFVGYYQDQLCGWKYSPLTIDGTPVATNVAVMFHYQLN
jgi:hypothetical protein